MRRVVLEPLTCTVVVRCKSTQIEIKTTTSEAIKILSGRTLFPTQATSVIDLDGNPLTLTDLRRMLQT